MPKVSIIVPVYKVEQYLEQCIESVLAQTMQDFQLILVDDGSPDSCPEICDRYVAQDNRITVIHKANGGLSSARNAAYEKATGAFIFFLDSDDYLESHALDNLLDAQQKSNADIVIGNYFYTFEAHEKAAAQFASEITLTGYQALEKLVNCQIQNFAWGKLIKTDLAKKHFFPEGKLFEDHYWAHSVLSEAEVVFVSSQPILHYRQRPSSISYSYTLDRLDMVDGWRARAEFLKENYPELLPQFLETVSQLYIDCAWLTCTKIKDGRKQAIKKLRMFEREYNLSSTKASSSKIALLLFKINIHAFCFFIVIKKLLNKGN